MCMPKRCPHIRIATNHALLLHCGPVVLLTMTACECSACSAMNLKLYNWDTLQDRAFRRLGRKLTASDCLGCATARPGAIERVLRLLQHLLLDGSQVSKVRGTVCFEAPCLPIQLLPLANVVRNTMQHECVHRDLVRCQCSLILADPVVAALTHANSLVGNYPLCL